MSVGELILEFIYGVMGIILTRGSVLRQVRELLSWVYKSAMSEMGEIVNEVKGNKSMFKCGIIDLIISEIRELGENGY